jgi:uncharacterized protein (TIGR02246 family)
MGDAFFQGVSLKRSIPAFLKEEKMDITLVRKAIENENLKFGEAVHQGDGAAIGALYTDDAAILPPNGEMIKGKAAIEAFWKGGLEMGIKEAVLTTVEVLGMGELAFEIGKYDLKIKPAGQAVIADSGKYVVLWKKQPDGAWKLHVDIWNTSLPAQK